MKRVLPVIMALAIWQTAFAQKVVPIDSVQYVDPQSLAKGEDDPIYFKNGNNGPREIVTIQGVVCPMHPGFYGLSATSRKSTMLWQKGSTGWGAIEVMADPGEGNNAADLNELLLSTRMYDNFIPGWTVKLTGELGDYQGNSQLYLTSDETEVVDPTVTEITPIVVTIDSFKNSAGDDQYVSGEKYEHMYVEFRNVVVEKGDEWSSGRWNWSIKQNGLELTIRDYSGYFRNDGNNDSTISSTFTPPNTGTVLEYIRGVIVQGNTNGYELAPLVPENVKQGTVVPPTLTSFKLTPSVPTPNDDIEFQISATDDDGVKDVILFVNIDGKWKEYAMTNSNGDDYSYKLGKQADGTLIQFYIKAVDKLSYESYYPNETGADSYIKVIDGGITKIAQIQDTEKASGESLFEGQTLSGIKINGIVTASLYDFNGLAVIQDATDSYSAIFVQTKAGDGIDLWERGDEIEITEATIVESFGVTYLSDIKFTVKSFANDLPARTLNLSIDSIAARAYNYTEAYEGMFLSFEDVVVASQNPDAPSTFGEWAFGKDTIGASLRVDDLCADMPDNFGLDSLTVGKELDYINGILYYSFGNWKLLPRDLNDVAGFGKIESIGTANNINFSVFPNPGSKVVRIRVAGDVTEPISVQVIDLAGKVISTTNSKSISSTQAIELNVESLNKGTYIIKVAGQTVQGTAKFIKN
ncbi:MAG: T9SS type A sorting domain-containing protein [Bacteroidetes bacterium]|nr:T9SS type A sorting domain-containing protein [Bacteroidota bacterium]